MERIIKQNKNEIINPSRMIDTPYPFLVIEDLSFVSKRIAPQRLDRDIQYFQDGLNSILKANMPEGSTFCTFSAVDVNTQIEQIIKSEIENPYKKVGVANLDRYLCSGIKSDSIFQINISRNISGGLSSRPGETTSPEDQIKKLIRWTKDNSFQELIITDDVLAFGDTLIPFILNLQKGIPNTKIRALVGLASSGGSWSGIENVKSATDITPEFITMVKASPETNLTLGMALPTSRDFTFLGGKVAQKGSTTLSYPYFLPFSIPVGSFMPQEKRVNSARELLALNRSLEHTLAEFWEWI